MELVATGIPDAEMAQALAQSSTKTAEAAPVTPPAQPVAVTEKDISAAKNFVPTFAADTPDKEHIVAAHQELLDRSVAEIEADQQPKKWWQKLGGLVGLHT